MNAPPNAPSLATLSPRQCLQRLRQGQLVLRTGVLTVAIQSDLPEVAAAIGRLYADNELLPVGEFADFHVSVNRVRGLRGWVRPQVVFEHEGARPFLPLPRAQSFAVLEWGLNWCIANYCHQFLMIHAAALERGGAVLVLCGASGVGKSTLCAALVHQGWRLLSDEITLIDLDEQEAVPLCRPLNLKNNAIELIGQFAPDALFGPVVPDTQKGRISHLKAPQSALTRSREAAPVRTVVFPRYENGASLTATSVPRHSAFLDLAAQSFNYSVLGERGFATLADVVERCDCTRLTYGDLQEAIGFFDALAGH